MKIAVVGAGKMGLPLAAQFASRGGQVIGCDVSESLVAAINAGQCPFDEPGLSSLVAAQVSAGRLSATTDTAAAVAQSEIIVVIVPALLTAELDVDPRILISVCKTIARSMTRGAMVSIETTLPVGGTRRFLLPELEAGRLVAGVDFDVVFSPERVKSRVALEHLTINPKIVGGFNRAAGERANRFYSEFLGAPGLDVGSLEAAEMVKLAGMVYRDVNIALANEMSRYAQAVGIDLPSLIAAINTDGEAHMLSPGIGVGGHCTPVYPYFYIRDAGRRGVQARLADLGRQLNDGQPAYAVDLLERTWRPVRGQEVAICGLAFRPGVKEHIYSPAFLLQGELQKRGANVSLCDPLYTPEEITAHGFVPLSIENLAQSHAIVVSTAHEEFLRLPLAKLREGITRAVLDGRNALDPSAVVRAGMTYVGIGRPTLASEQPA